ncbi:hypothetical protein QR680_005420 [Steinernema hermaphroditum]|uniref:URB1 C-terminal domain-containing protein n=1 Tax=Steinernema hermaphroditum TaxID=289476 RepID=A0AA39HRZ6_9BILA|nr:hypothetical protein QR680_005420 [Steinernema hermaphroditum]
MGARKRKLAESLLAVNSGPAIKDEFRELCQEVAKAEKLDRKMLKTLKTFLLDAKDSSGLEFVPAMIDFKLLTSLLSNYTATQSKNDRLILDILFTLERTFSINLQALKPLAFGPTSKENYDSLFKYGHALFSRMKPDNVLDLFDAKSMWFSIMNLDDSLVAADRIKQNKERVYDPEFVLRLFATLLETGSELSTYKFVDCNGLGFVFACLSLHNDKLRSLAYFTMQRFLAHLNALTNEVFSERALILYLVRTFKNSVTKQNQRLSHIISHFFARVSKLLLNPDDPVYGPIMAFLTMKPTIDLENVPEMYKLLLSSSTLHNRRERQWILKLIAASLIEPHDYHVLEKRYGMKLCMSLYGSCISDPISREIIVNLMESCVQLPSVARDLYNRLNLHTWVALMIEKTYLKNSETLSLYRLFYSLLERIRAICLEDVQPGSPFNVSVAMKERMAKVVGKHVVRQLAKLNEKEGTEGDRILLEKLEKLVAAPWQEEEKKCGTNESSSSRRKRKGSLLDESFDDGSKKKRQD